MKFLVALGLLIFSVTPALAQGLNLSRTEVQYLRVISVAGPNGNYLASIDEDHGNLKPLSLVSWDLRNFNKYFADRMHGNMMLVCSMNIYQNSALRYLEGTDNIEVQSVRVCMDEYERIVAVGIDTFEPKELLVSQDIRGLRSLASTPLRPMRYGDNSERGTSNKDFDGSPARRMGRAASRQ